MESLTPQQFIQKLQQAYPDLTTKDIAEILWLAQQIKETPSLEQATDLPPLQGDELALSTDVLSQKIATPHPTPGTNEPLPSLSERDEFHHRFQKFDASDSDYRAGYPIKSPTGSAMPGELELARSLRPLLHKVPSRTSRRLNVTATALRIAETEKKVLMPILQPDSQRWLDVALVIDTGASMIIWQDTIKELKALLEHLGAFRNVRAWYLATDDRQEAVLLADSGPAISLYYPANQEPSIGIDEKLHRRSAGELIDPSKQRLILVVTDCVSPSWHSGKVQELIRLWGQQNIVTIVQMLPRPLWRRTALGYADIVQVHAPSPGCINTRLTLRHAFSWFDDEQRPLPIPVFTLEPGSVGGWAKMIIGAPGSWATGVIFPPLSTEGSSLPVRQHDPQPATRVAQFRAASSSTSVKLAGLLSAAPISLPVIRLIQRALLPNSNQVHLAEVLLSGLLKKIPSNETIEDPNDVEYDFLPGVRELLLDPVPLAYSIEVLEKTSVLVAQHYGENREFKALAVPTLPLAEAAEQIPISPRSRRFALIAAAVWRGAGGSYVDWADKIQEKAQHVEEEEFDFNITNNHDSTIFSPNKTLIDVTDPIPETVAANATEPVPSIVSTSPDEKKEQISIPPTSFIPLPRDLSYQERPGEFEAVDRLLGSRQAERPRVIAISGMAGIGKTHMVIELAHQYVERERFPGGVFWMSEPGPSIFDWQRELARLAVVTGFLPSDDGSSITTNEQWRAQRFSQYLANRDDALLILDNVEYPELIAPMLSSLAGEMPTCAILYTSRHTEIPPGTRHYTVPSLPEAAALRLLLSGNKHSRVLEDITLGRTDAETDSARSLCRFVGYLPLALIHLRGQLEEDIRLTLVVLARELIREKAPDALEPLFRTLRLSWGYLDAQARDMFKRAVCFPEAQPLPLWLLGMVSGLGVDEETTEKFANRLASMNFIERLADQQQALLHPLLRNFGLRIIEEEGHVRGNLHNEMIRRLENNFCDPQRLQQLVERDGYWRGLEQVQVASAYAAMLQPRGNRGNLLQYVEHWLTRDSDLLSDQREWLRLLPALLYQQMYNHGIEEDVRLPAWNPPGSSPWLRLEAAVQGGDQVFRQRLIGHEGPVLSVAFSRDGQRIVTGSDDGTARMWDAATGKMLLILAGHTQAVWSVAFSPDDLQILTGSVDHSARVWDTRSGKEILRLEGHGGLVMGVAFSADGQRALTGSWDRTVRVWDMKHGRVVGGFATSRTNCIAFAPGGTRALVGLWDGTVQVWEESGESWSEVRQFMGHAGNEVRCVAFSPDGNRAISGADDRTARIWNVNSGKELCKLIGHSESVSSVAFSSDGRWATTGSWDETVRLWDIADAQERISLESPQGKVRSVAFAPDGKRIIAGSDDSAVQLWEIEDSQIAALRQGRPDRVNCIAILPDGKRILAGTERGTIRVWGVKNKELMAEWVGSDSAISCVTFSPRGSFTLAGTLDGSVFFWEGVPGNRQKPLKRFDDAVTFVAFSPDGTRMLASSRDGATQVWQTSNQSPTHSPPAQSVAVTCATFSSNGSRILTGHGDGNVVVWDTFNMDQISRFTEHDGPVNRIVCLDSKFARFSDRLALSVSDDGTARLWEQASGWQRDILPGTKSPLKLASFSPNGRLALACDARGWVYLWSIAEDKGMLHGLYVTTYPIIAVDWISATHLLLADTGGLDGRSHFYHLRLEGKWE